MKPALDGGELDMRSLLRAALVLAPLIALAAVTGQNAWLQAAIVTMSAYIAMDRSGLAPLGVILHGVAIAIAFLALLLALIVPPLFVAGAALLAAVAILLTGKDASLRSLGNFTFIPALYLACDIAEGVAPGEYLRLGLDFLPFLAVAMVPVLVLSSIDHVRRHDPRMGRFASLGRFLRTNEFGGRLAYGEAMAAIALAVAAAAGVAVWLHLGHMQWIVWSAASVVTGDVASGRRKLQDRATGAIVGVPVGIALGLILPHDVFSFALVTVVAMLSLVAIRRYVLAFGLRCACAALVLMLAGQSTLIAAERAGNVLLGCLIGIVFVVAMHGLATAWPRQRHRA